MFNSNQLAVANEIHQHPISYADSSTAANSQPAAVSNSAYQAGMVSGFGQYHTNEYDPDQPNKKLKPYVTVSWSEIVAMVKNPQEVAKEYAQWFIPSTLASRTFKKQEENGEYWVLPSRAIEG